jgi:hypothetical protein
MEFSASLILRYVLAVLAVWRIVHATTLETGPFAVFEKAREATNRRFGFESWQAEFMRCALCQSFWGSFIAALLFFPMISNIPDLLLVWGSLAGGVTILHLTVYRH